MDINEWSGKKVRVSLKSGLYYKGLVLSIGDEFMKMRDFRDKIIFIRVDQITIIQGWEEK